MSNGLQKKADTNTELLHDLLNCANLIKRHSAFERIRLSCLSAAAAGSWNLELGTGEQRNSLVSSSSLSSKCRFSVLGFGGSSAEFTTTYTEDPIRPDV